MKITTRKHVWFTVLVINLLGAAIVTAAIVGLYPPHHWPYEITLSLTLTFVIATPTSYFMALQLLKNNQLTNELQRLVDRDRLTDVATRDFFFGKMNDDVDAYGVSLMVDIDKFKQINDTYGHIAGDQVIKCVAQILKNSVRERDIVARFGGEEFVIFLYEQNSQSGYASAEIMRERIASQKFSFKDLDVRVTVSIGGSMKTACDNVERAIREADEALYQAKKDGRNRTVFSALGEARRNQSAKISSSVSDQQTRAVA